MCLLSRRNIYGANSSSRRAGWRPREERKEGETRDDFPSGKMGANVACKEHWKLSRALASSETDLVLGLIRQQSVQNSPVWGAER